MINLLFNAVQTSWISLHVKCNHRNNLWGPVCAINHMIKWILCLLTFYTYTSTGLVQENIKKLVRDLLNLFHKYLYYMTTHVRSYRYFFKTRHQHADTCQLTITAFLITSNRTYPLKISNTQVCFKGNTASEVKVNFISF